MIQAIRTTVRGTDSLENYIDGKEAFVNQTRKWTPTQRAITCLAIIQDDSDDWIFIRDVLARLQDEDEVWDDDSFNSVIAALERDGMIDVFREITDNTYLKCEVGQWTFWTQWTVLRKQTNADLSSTVQDLLCRGFAIVKGDPEIRITVK